LKIRLAHITNFSFPFAKLKHTTHHYLWRGTHTWIDISCVHQIYEKKNDNVQFVFGDAVVFNGH